MLQDSSRLMFIMFPQFTRVQLDKIYQCLINFTLKIEATNFTVHYFITIPCLTASLTIVIIFDNFSNSSGV